MGQCVSVCECVKVWGCWGGFLNGAQGAIWARESEIRWKNAIMHPGPLQLLVVCFPHPRPPPPPSPPRAISHYPAPVNVIR